MRILWLKTELLHPIDKGGRIRTYHMLRELRAEHDITYLALDDGSATPEAVEAAAEYCERLIRVPHRITPKSGPRFYGELIANLASPLPYFVSKYRSTAMREAIAREVATGSVDVLVCDFLMPAVNVPQEPGVPAVLFQHNVEAMIWRRHHEVAEHPLRKAYFRRQWKKAVDFERRACRRFDRVVAVSDADRDAIRETYGVERVAVVPTGVDVEFFRPSGAASPLPHHLVFTGSMDWLPNEDGILFFVEEVLPRVRDSVPDVSLSVVGRDPPERLRERATRDSAVTVTGRVPDVRPYMEEAAVFVVPLRIGGGTRLKIYEAMAMEMPVVATPVGMEGLPIRDGAELLVAETADDFAAAVVRLLHDPEAARALAQNAARRVRAAFGWTAVSAEFAAICESVARDAGAGPSDESVNGEERLQCE